MAQPYQKTHNEMPVTRKELDDTIKTLARTIGSAINNLQQDIANTHQYTTQTTNNTQPLETEISFSSTPLGTIATQKTELVGWIIETDDDKLVIKSAKTGLVLLMISNDEVIIGNATSGNTATSVVLPQK